MIKSIASFSVERPVTVIMTFLALCVLGSIAWTRIPLEMMPGGFSLNRMWVAVQYRDSTPRETEQQVVRPMEDHLSTAPGLKEMDTRSSRGSARASLAFHRSVSMDAAYNAVVERMERAMADFPDEVERYWIYRWNPGDEPILWGGISIPDSVDDTHQLITEVVQKRLERVPGVGNVELWGVNPKAVFVDFNLDSLMAHGINLQTVMGSLGSDNFQMASGRIVDRGKVRYVRSLARYETLEEMKSYPVGNNLVLSDIATVTHRSALSAHIARIDGEDGVAFGVYKESDNNTVDVARALKETFLELEQDPRCQGIKFVTFFDQGDLIQDSIDNLLNTALWGGIFAVIVLFAFLRQWKMTLLIAACIPFTLLLTVTTTYFAGRSLNLLSLMGLMLAVGMVVDNAIVVVESIDARRQKGDAVKEAAVKGTTNIGLAITLSTLTTMVVFLPIILMSGNADFSFFMSELGMPVVWALGISLLVALFFTPLTTTIIRKTKVSSKPTWVSWLSKHYRRSLRWFLSNRTDALMILISLVFVTMVVPVQAVGCNQDSEGNLEDFRIRYKVSADASYEDRVSLVDTIDEYVESNKDRWGVRTWRARMQANSRRGGTTVYLANRDDGMLKRSEVIDDAKANLPEIAGVELGIGWGGSNGPPANQIEIFLHGEDTRTLERLGTSVQRVLNAIPGVVGAVSEMAEEGGREIRLSVNRDSASRLGISPRQIGRTIGFALRTSSLPEFQDGKKEVPVAARFRLEDRQDLGRLMDFPMFSPTTMKVVPLRTLTKADYAQGISSIHRENRITSYPISVDLEDGLSKEQAWSTMERALRAMQFPDGYSWSKSWSQEKDREEDSARNMALLLSVVFVFLIMGVLFESFLLPMSIITTVPMAFLGVYWMLFITDTNFDTMSGVGLVILVGVVVNNGIVYIDLVTRLRDQGADRLTALIDGGTQRLRPILMTALTTIFGLIPMTIGDASFVGMPYAPLGRVVVGGLSAGTLLTLFLLPFLYTILDDIRGTGSRWVAHLIGQQSTSEVSK